MATLILPKESAVTAFAITVAGLASSTAGVGRQSTLVDNTSNRYNRIYGFAKIKLGTSPTSNSLVTIYLVRGDETPIRTDNAGASDAAITLKNAVPVWTLTTGPSAATGDVLYGDFVIDDPGKYWAIAIVNSTGVALDSTAANHVLEWYGEDPEFQE